MCVCKRPVSLISIILSETAKLYAFVEKHQKENLSLEGFILNNDSNSTALTSGKRKAF